MTSSKKPVDIDGTSNLTTGRAAYTANYYLDGGVDEIRVAGVARTNAWLNTEYNNQNSAGTFISADIVEELIDTTAPLAITFSPIDNGTSVLLAENLVITFDDWMEFGTGNLDIYQANGNLFESISATGSQMTGNGGTSITINPSSNFAGNSEYYVWIQATAFEDDQGNAFAGISSGNGWSFTTGSIAAETWKNYNWTNRNKITIEAEYVNGDVTHFPVYIDLNHMPASFFTIVQSDGSDIRVSEADGITPVPVELVHLDTANGTGELFFRATSLSSSLDTDFFIYYGNSTIPTPNRASPYGAQNVWTNGYVAVYHMDQNPSDTNARIFDSTSNRYHASVNGSMTSADLVAGQVGRALDFDGSNDFLQVPADPDAGYLNDYSMETWVEMDAFTPSVARNYVLDWRGSGPASFQSNGIGMFIDDDTTDELNNFAQYLNGSYSQYIGSLPGSHLNNWMHYVNQRTGSTLESFMNGESLSISYQASTTSTSEAMPIYRGFRICDYSNSTNSDYLCDGILDEIRLSSKARSDAWIKTGYDNVKTPNSFYTIENGNQLNSTIDSKPKITSLYPKPGSKYFPTSANLEIGFNENVTIDNGDITIYQENGSLFENIDANSASVTGSGTSTITINPSTDFSPGSGYYILIESSVFMDSGSNYFDGMYSPNTWSFTTQGSKTPNAIFLFGF